MSRPSWVAPTAWTLTVLGILMLPAMIVAFLLGIVFVLSARVQQLAGVLTQPRGRGLPQLVGVGG